MHFYRLQLLTDMAAHRLPPGVQLTIKRHDKHDDNNRCVGEGERDRRGEGGREGRRGLERGRMHTA